MRQTTLSQEAINSIAQFVRIIIKILENLFRICRSFVNDIKVKELKSRYEEEEMIFEIRRFVLKHIMNLDQVLLNFELVRCIISEEKSQFCMSKIKIMSFVYDFNDRRSESFKVIKIIKWASCQNIISVRAFIEICLYYRVWVEHFVIIAEFIFRLFKKNAIFVWEEKQQKIMN